MERPRLQRVAAAGRGSGRGAVTGRWPSWRGRGGARGLAGARGPLKLGGVAACGTCQEMEAVRPLFLSFLCATGRTSPTAHGAEDYAFICILGQGLELDGEEGDPAVAAAQFPRLLLLGGGFPSTLSWCPRPSSKLSGPQCCPGRDKSTLFVSLVPQRDD